MRCSTYCTASSYNFPALLEHLKQKYPATSYRGAIHVAHSPEADIYYFPYGVIVFWGCDEKEELEVLQRIKPFEIDPLSKFERDIFEFSYGDTTRIQRDEFILNSKDPVTKLAVSFGLAQSMKLSVFEDKIYRTIEKTKHLPEDLARKGRIFLSRKEISKKIGELFIERSSVNLHSDILDAPDFFWEYPEYDPLYRTISNYLDIAPRVEVLNTRLTIVGELLSMLSDQLNHQHSSTLELTIIWLIVIEVILAVLRDLFHLI